MACAASRVSKLSSSSVFTDEREEGKEAEFFKDFIRCSFELGITGPFLRHVGQEHKWISKFVPAHRLSFF